MRAFVDSSALYAAADRSDGQSGAARAALSEYRDGLITSDHVLVESWLLARARRGAEAAESLWRRLRLAGTAVESIGPADLEAAWRIGEAWADQGFSIVDRTSFAVMERLGITRVISFDEDFAVYRYGPRRSRAFEVVR